NKHGFIKTDQIQQEYRQALKGDNASLREKEWRTNPDYKIPQRLWDNPLIIADRDAVLDKIRNDEELEEWEKKMTHIFTDAVEGAKIYNDAMLTQLTHRIEKGITKALAEVGIALDADDVIKFEVWGYEMKVMGNFDDEKLHTMLDALSRYAWSMNAVFVDNHPMSKESAVELGQLQLAEKYLKDTGVTLFDLSLDEKGNLVGLPEEIDDFIKEYANKPLYRATTIKIQQHLSSRSAL
ncbi:MAG: hypothetical protein J1F28_11075, partial [Oscillospiraceae bacterium]|nr:hypothetical protein [Oscillospiraceae bacterium]